MQLKPRLMIKVTMVIAGLIWFVALGGCDVSDLVDDIEADITISIPDGLLPAGNPDDDGFWNRISELYAVEVDDETWAMVASFNGGCLDPETIIYSEAALWAETAGHEWTKRIVMPLSDHVCIAGLMVWQPIPQPCLDKLWCGLPEPWLSLRIEDNKGFVDQAFTQPGGELPIP